MTTRPAPSDRVGTPAGPYVVTVYADGLGERVASRVASRRAFARLYGFPGSASARVWEVVHAAHATTTFKVHEWKAARTAIHQLPATGGTVDLPDGTVIEVEATTWEAIFDAIVAVDPDAPGRSLPLLPPRMWSAKAKAKALSIFNAAQPASASQAGEGR